MGTTLKNLPFCLGPRETPSNPIGLPDVLDLCLALNDRYSMLEQQYSEATTHLLGLGYSHRIPLGTPSNDTDLGTPYVEEFLEYIEGVSSQKGTVLEIGAGTGYLSYRLKKNGWEVTSLEPGSGYEHDWKRFGLSVVTDFYPSKEISGRFDLIIMYTVLEHIIDVEKFLNLLKDQMTMETKLVIAVPDCTEELMTIDPSMIIHEHARYFTEKSLSNLLRVNGFSCEVKRSSFGRSLFAQAEITSDSNFIVDASEIRYINEYLTNINREIESVREKIRSIASEGRLAIYCPSRMINLLPADCEYQFIDDDLSIHGKYYPPFQSEVHGIDNLETETATTLIIGSRTFFHSIRMQLPTNNWNVIGITELLNKEI